MHLLCTVPTWAHREPIYWKTFCFACFIYKLNASQWAGWIVRPNDKWPHAVRLRCCDITTSKRTSCIWPYCLEYLADIHTPNFPAHSSHVVRCYMDALNSASHPVIKLCTIYTPLLCFTLVNRKVKNYCYWIKLCGGGGWSEHKTIQQLPLAVD